MRIALFPVDHPIFGKLPQIILSIKTERKLVNYWQFSFSFHWTIPYPEFIPDRGLVDWLRAAYGLKKITWIRVDHGFGIEGWRRSTND